MSCFKYWCSFRAPEFVLIEGEAYFHIAISVSDIRDVTLMCLSLYICRILVSFQYSVFGV